MNERQTVRCQFPSQRPCRQPGLTIVEGTSMIVCGKHAGAVRELRGFTPAPVPRTEDQATIEAAAVVVRAWRQAQVVNVARLNEREPRLTHALQVLSERWPS